MKRLILVISLLLPGTALAENAVDAAIKGFLGLAGIYAMGYAVVFIFKLMVSATRKVKTAAVPKVKKLAIRGKDVIRDIGKSEESKILDLEDVFFEMANDEIVEKTVNAGLWAKSIAIADGDNNKQRAIYLRLRAKQLKEYEQE